MSGIKLTQCTGARVDEGDGLQNHLRNHNGGSNPSLYAMETKLCTKCGKEKPISEFSKSARRADGLQRYCKSCMAEYNRIHYRKIKRFIEPKQQKEQMNVENK